jgi:indolepyruvate ferredoxin oxidoreductase
LLLSISETASDTVVANFDDLAQRLIGDSMASNLMALGAAAQKGQLPVKVESIEEALKINGVSVKQNLNAFMWGRQIGHDLDAVMAVAIPKQPVVEPTTVEEVVAHRVAELNDWALDGGSMAAKYEKAVRRAQALEQEILPLELRGGDQPLALNVAKYYYKLLAYKDEFEVGRLHQLTNEQLHDTFTTKDDEPFTIRYSLGHELFKLVPDFVYKEPFSHITKHVITRHGTRGKVMMPGWIVTPMFKALAQIRWIRSWKINLMRFTAERRVDFKLLAEYESMLGELSSMTPENYRTACQLAAFPEKIRGYGFVREQHVEKHETEREELVQLFRNPVPLSRATAASLEGVGVLSGSAEPAKQKVAARA